MNPYDADTETLQMETKNGKEPKKGTKRKLPVVSLDAHSDDDDVSAPVPRRKKHKRAVTAESESAQDSDSDSDRSTSVSEDDETPMKLASTPLQQRFGHGMTEGEITKKQKKEINKNKRVILRAVFAELLRQNQDKEPGKKLLDVPTKLIHSMCEAKGGECYSRAGLQNFLTREGANPNAGDLVELGRYRIGCTPGTRGTRLLALPADGLPVPSRRPVSLVPQALAPATLSLDLNAWKQTVADVQKNATGLLNLQEAWIRDAKRQLIADCKALASRIDALGNVFAAPVLDAAVATASSSSSSSSSSSASATAAAVAAAATPPPITETREENAKVADG